MPCGFHRGFALADDTIRVHKCGGFEKFAADVALVASSFFTATVGTFAFYKAVGQETLVVFAVEHLSVLGEDVTVLLDFKKGFLDEFFVNGALSAGVVVKGSVPFTEEICYSGVIAVSQSFRGDALSYRLYLDGCTMRV